MTTLKEQIARDNRAFLSPSEFGDEMMVDGVPCLGCWDLDEVQQPVQGYFGASMEDVLGVFTVERLLFVMRADGGPMETPVPEQELDVDGIRWTVRDARPERGILEINLYRNQS